VTAAAWIAFLAAAALGAPARYVVDRFVQVRTRGVFPWGTLVVNVTGCLGLGTLTGLGLFHGLRSGPQTVVGSGGIGAYTTFSTFAYETVRLLEQGATKEAVRSVIANAGLGVTAAGVGLALATAL
jgi:CrcB protein